MARDNNDASIPLRLRYPFVFDQLIERLKCVGLNAYDVITECVGPTQAGEVAVRVHHGEGYRECMEQTFRESMLQNVDAEVLGFIEQVAEDCQERSIADYRTFMGRVRP